MARYIQLELNPSGPVPEISEEVITESAYVSLDIDVDTYTITVLGQKRVTGVALYSHLKEQWKKDDVLIRYDFPMMAMSHVYFDMLRGWQVTNPDMLVFDLSEMRVGLENNLAGNGVRWYQRTGLEARGKDIRL